MANPKYSQLIDPQSVLFVGSKMTFVALGKDVDSDHIDVGVVNSPESAVVPINRDQAARIRDYLDYWLEKDDWNAEIVLNPYSKGDSDE